MCNRFRQAKGYADLTGEFSHARITLRFPEHLGDRPNLEPCDDIRPTNKAAMLRLVDNELHYVHRRWDLVPFFHKGPLKAKKYLCTNARSETVATQPAFRDAFKKRRCLIPVDRFYEWTGEKGAKTKWMIDRIDGEPFYFAGLWDRSSPDEGELESFTFLTSAAGEDMRTIHDRQPVMLRPDHWEAWLDTAHPIDELIRPARAGTYKIELAPPEEARP